MRKFLLLVLLVGFFALSLETRSVFAGEIDILLQKLVDKGVLTTAEAQQIGTETKEQVKKEIAEGKSPSLPQWVQNIKLKGDFRLREEWKKDKGSDDLSRTRIRVRLGLEDKINPKLKLGVGIATGNPKDPRSRNVTLGTTGEATNTDWDPGAAKNIVLDYAYAEWAATNWMTLTGGKFQNPLWRPADILWKSDITPEGAAANLSYNLNPKFKIFMNDMLFILRNPDTNGGKQPIMAAFQPGFGLDITNKTNLKFAVTDYIFNGLKGSPKFVYSKGTTQSGNSLDSSGNYKYNYNAVNPNLEIGFKEPFGGLIPYASIYGDYIYNVSLPSNATGAGGFDMGVKFGAESVSDWGQWQAKLTYQKLGRDCWVDAFTDVDRYSGKTNAKVYKASLDYGLGKNTWLTLAYYYGESLTKLAGLGRLPENALQVDWNMKF
jgi:hypothetical protein